MMGKVHQGDGLVIMITKTLFYGLLLSGSIALMSGCSLVRPYHIQIQQGQLLSSEKIQKIKPGMTKEQVKYTLGMPNQIDPYHSNTWYYIYTNQIKYEPPVEKKLIVYFDKDGKVSGLGGDYPPPSNLEYTTYTDKAS